MVKNKQLLLFSMMFICTTVAHAASENKYPIIYVCIEELGTACQLIDRAFSKQELKNLIAENYLREHHVQNIKQMLNGEATNCLREIQQKIGLSLSSSVLCQLIGAYTYNKEPGAIILILSTLGSAVICVHAARFIIAEYKTKQIIEHNLKLIDEYLQESQESNAQP